MADEVDIECPSCGAVFGVPVELCGEMAQCAECEVIFEIPSLDEGEDEGEDEVSTDTGVIKGIEADSDATNTVRLSRTGIGMIPQIKDDFMSGFPVSSVPAPPKANVPKPSPPPEPPPEPPAVSSAPPPVASAPLVSSSPQSPSKAESAFPAGGAGENVQLPSWIKLRMMKDETVESVKEGAHSSVVGAILVLVFVFVAGGAGIFMHANITVAGAAVGGLAIVAFVVFLLTGKSRMVLVVTSKRTVCFIGNERLEIKK